MPYEKTSDLPASVRDNLPEHAQDIYRSAFNNAYEEYSQDEERSHRVAWGAVKKVYSKDRKTGKWKKKD